ncbi:MAG: lysylphosphatidylglycerol synthase domain-containing protein [Anaerolineales bacterium]
MGGILSAAAFVYFIVLALQHKSTFPPGIFSPRILLIILGMAIIYLVIIFLNGWIWHLLLVGSGGTEKFLDSVIIFVQAQFAKYIPGNIAQHLGRVALARAYGMHIPRVLFSMAMEVAWMILSASSLGVVTLLFLGASDLGVSSFTPSVWQLLFIGIAAIALPIIGVVVLDRWRPAWLKKLYLEGEFKRPGSITLFVVFLVDILSLATVGWMADGLAAGIFHAPQRHILSSIGIYAIAWVVGFLTPGAPAGIGIREVILATAYTRLYGESAALGVTLSLRMITMIGDALAFIIGVTGSAFLRSSRKRPA